MWLGDTSEDFHRAIGLVSVNVTGEPAIFTQTVLHINMSFNRKNKCLLVKGSEPSCSVVKPFVLMTLPGTVTGIVVVHVFWVVVRVTPVIVCAVGLIFQESFGEQASLAIREAKPAAI